MFIALRQARSGIVRPGIETNSWYRYGFIDLFSDFVSVSSASAGSLVGNQEGGWWIYPNGNATYVSLTKHRTFDLYRLSFTPDNPDDHQKQAQIWEIDREPVSENTFLFLFASELDRF